MSLPQTVLRAMRTLAPSPPVKQVVVAVSGGADSIALLYALHDVAPRAGYALTVVHVHHGLRGREADADARFVRAQAKHLSLACRVRRVDTRGPTRARGASLEMAAREARYAVLSAIARRLAGRTPGAVVIATAHTADDQAETVLWRVARGAGARGLGGIPVQRDLDGIRVVRPLLSVSRRTLTAFLQRRGTAWREDASNADRAHVRNRIRHDVLPFLRRVLNPRIDEALQRTAELLAAEDAWMDAIVVGLLPDALSAEPIESPPTLRVDVVGAQPIAARRRLVKAWLVLAGIAPEAIDFTVVDGVCAFLDSRGRRPFRFGGRWTVQRQGNALRLAAGDGHGRAAEPRAFHVVLRVPGRACLPEAGVVVSVSRSAELVRERPALVGGLPARATVAWSRVTERPLVIRSWRRGDRMQPYGLRGSQKLQDIFVNAKVPRDARARIPIFTSGDEIVWIPGYRIARGWQVRSARQRIAQLSVEAAT